MDKIMSETRTYTVFFRTIGLRLLLLSQVQLLLGRASCCGQCRSVCNGSVHGQQIISCLCVTLIIWYLGFHDVTGNEEMRDSIAILIAGLFLFCLDWKFICARPVLFLPLLTSHNNKVIKRNSPFLREKCAQFSLLYWFCHTALHFRWLFCLLVSLWLTELH